MLSSCTVAARSLAQKTCTLDSFQFFGVILASIEHIIEKYQNHYRMTYIYRKGKWMLSLFKILELKLHIRWI